MKCPKCLKEINDAASFCGYCGQVINRETTQNASVEEPVNAEVQTKQEPTTQGDANKLENESNTKKRKKHIGLKILLIFSIIAIAAGTVLGLLTAKGIIDLSKIIPSNRFEWTDFSEALETENESSDSEELLPDKEQTGNEDSDNFSSKESAETENETVKSENESTGSVNNTSVTENTNANANSRFLITTKDGEEILNASAIKSCNVFEDEIGGSVGLIIKLNDEGEKKFAKATLNNIGKTLNIYIDGVLICAPTVTQEITGGGVFITCSDKDRADQLNLELNDIIK